MRRNPVSPIVFAAALSVCAVEPEQLNSDRIRQRFGSYGIEVLTQSGSLRRSNLYSTHAGVRVCRTYAVVQYAEPGRREIAEPHNAVLAGHSIGSTFREAGWTIEKHSAYIGVIESAALDPDIVGRMRLTANRSLAVHVYRLTLVRGDLHMHYASIIEVHHPDYLDEQELHALYDDDLAPAPDGAVPARIVALIQSD